jgi:peptidoglycan/LPS O-acetylase OafA/YrhL
VTIGGRALPLSARSAAGSDVLSDREVSSAAATSNSTYRSELDGLRYVAVVLVIAFHAGLGTFVGGYVGVDVFFVLSGFLITGLLVHAAERGQLRLVEFYARRARRLLPAALVVLVVTCLVWLAIASFIERGPLIGDARSAGLYYSNWHFAAQSTDYFASQNAQSPFIHFWSLSVEEQFYLVWPALVLLCYRGRAGRRFARRRLGVLAAVLCAGSLASLAIYTAHGSTAYAYFGTPPRIYQLLVGALLALWAYSRRSRGTHAVPESTGWPLLIAGKAAQLIALIGVVLCATTIVHLGSAGRGLAATGMALAGLWGFEIARSSSVQSLLGIQVISYLGRISYGTYLWHWPLILLTRHFVHMSAFAMFLAAGGAATGLAALSYRVLELPIRQSPRLAQRSRGVVLAAVASSLVIGALVVPAPLTNHARPSVVPVASIEDAARPVVPDPRETGGRQTGMPTSATTPATLPTKTPSPGQSAIAAARSPHPSPAVPCLAKLGRSCLVHRGSGKTVAVIGDSHVEAFLPVFAQFAVDHDLTLYDNLSYVCPWEAPVLVDGPNAPSCRRNQQDWLTNLLDKVRPDVTIVVNRGYDDPKLPSRPLYIDGSPDQTDSAATLVKALPASVGRILQSSKHLVVIEPWPSLAIDQNECLSRKPYAEQCAAVASSSKLPDETAIEALAKSDNRVATVDMDDLVGPRLPICDALVDGVIVRRDFDHLSIPYAAHIAPALEKRILALELI